MGAYLDRLNDQFDTITQGIDEVLNRAAEDNRDVTTDEQQLVEREQAKAEELKKTIEHYAGIEATRGKVAEVRSRIPAATTVARSAAPKQDTPPEVTELFRDAGEYITTAASAMRGDQSAAERLQRATANQTTAENPGLIPRPLVGPVIEATSNARPFISAISQHRLPAGSFDRPALGQHVAVGKQSGELQPTDSQELKVDKLPVRAETYAGHLKLSRQDIRWTQPGVMQLVVGDFVHAYSVATDKDAVSQFAASLKTTPAVKIASFDAHGVTAAIFEAASSVMAAGDGAPLPDTLFVSPDVWGQLGSLVNNNGTLVFPSVTPTATTGNPLGLRLVVDPHFAAKTAVVGPARYAEWYEDIDGLLTIGEPDVWGQMVGYAGFGAFLNTKPDLFRKLTLPTAAPANPSKTDEKPKTDPTHKADPNHPGGN